MSRVAVLIVSDRAARGERADGCLAVVARWAAARGHEIVADALVADDEPAIETALRTLYELRVDLIVTSGGTGFSARDVTPEATRRVIERPTPGIDETLRRLSYEKHATAVLSRAVSGIRGATLILNLPGNPRAVDEQLAWTDPFLAHGLDVLQGADHG